MKSVFKSKTIWMNAILAVVSIIALINPEFLTAVGIDASNQQKVITLLGTVAAILNLFLRFITSDGLQLSSKKDA